MKEFSMATDFCIKDVHTIDTVRNNVIRVFCAKDSGQDGHLWFYDVTGAEYIVPFRTVFHALDSTMHITTGEQLDDLFDEYDQQYGDTDKADCEIQRTLCMAIFDSLFHQIIDGNPTDTREEEPQEQVQKSCDNCGHGCSYSVRVGDRMTDTIKDWDCEYIEECDDENGYPKWIPRTDEE